MKTSKLYLYLSFLFIALASLPGCRSVDKLVESGNYEETIELAQRRLTGKDRKNPKYVAALEKAVNRANERNVEEARRIEESGTPDWVRIHSIYTDIQRRQDALQPLLPLEDKNGRPANFKFVRVEPLIVTAAERAAEQLYTEAGEELTAARAGDKAAARTAYATLERIGRYQSDYRDVAYLSGEAERLGHVFVKVDVENRSGGYLPRGFNAELLRVRTTEMNDRWRTYDFEARSDRQYDYRAGIIIDDIQVSPERENQREYREEKEITDGEEYVLDGNGNVAKDTLGNDITRPRRIIVTADVIEVLQTKSAIVTGSLRLFDLRSDRVVQEEELSAEAVFENYASTFRGDRRALSRDSRSRIGNQPVPFPTDEELILTAADELKPQLQNILRRSYRVI